MTRAPRTILVLSVGLALLLAAFCIAQAQKDPGIAKPKLGAPKKLAPRDEAAPKEKDEFRINNAARVRYDTKRGLFYLYGDVEFQDEDMILVCDEASYNENDDTAACAGRLKMTDPENVITGELVNADFEAEIVNIIGKVKIVTTKDAKQDENAEGDGGEKEKRVTTITCDKIEYFYTKGERRAVAVGDVKIVQEDRTTTAQRADYDREKDLIVLGDKVLIRMDNGNEFECIEATISVTEDWIEMEQFKGKGIRDKKKNPKPAE